ncbi:hypothetical protein GCM10023185_41590 [Hymenobacter saemangeumensis]|uniref:LTD domain-containing protein n=1 Tax=Hymenobacter saemangeumensis TaxID=1084522 RepID=A0ABP8IRE7_9BACT
MRLYTLAGLLLLLAFSPTFTIKAQTFPTVPPPPPAALRDAALRDWLRQNWYDGKRTVLSYAAARAKLYNYVDNQAGQVRCVYSGYTEPKTFSFSSTSTTMTNINCEHTVPQSWFNEVERMRSDIHHLFPTVIQWNADRGDDPFGEIPDAQTLKWMRGLNSQTSIPSSNLPEWSEDTNTMFEPREDHKGNLARAVFYFYTMHANQTFDAGKGVISAVGNLNTLYQWHQQDPVDAQEFERNRRAAASQGNYNPYINDPSLVARAWGFQPVGTVPSVQFAASTGSITEGNSGTTAYTFSVTLSAEPGAAASVQVAVDAAGSTASAGSDYTFTTPQTLSFGPGLPLTQTLTVTVNGDATVEPDETLLLVLQNPSANLSLGSPAAHTLTIVNDDMDAASVLAFATASLSRDEGNSNNTYTVNVTLTPAATSTVTVPVQVDAANSSADAGDYTLTTTSLTFTAGQTTRTVSVSIVGDLTVEPDEVLRLRLGTPTGATLGSTSTHNLTLLNDDFGGDGSLSCGGLLFTEYIESTAANNKALEIYNPSDQTINLAGYRVQLFANGATTPTTTLNLRGTLGGREVYVIINNQADNQNLKDQADVLSGVTGFNGDDALVLSFNGTVLDVIGTVGERPAIGYWPVAGGSTKDYTLVRNPNVMRGQASWTAAAPGWTAIGQDQYDFLGFQTANACGAAPMPVTLSYFRAQRSTPTAVQLSWGTAQELGNAYFLVEKSADGQRFQACGQRAGNGTTTTAHSYQLLDEKASGAAYYRLRQVDLDGRSNLSPVLYVPAAPVARAQVLPNPSTGTVELSGLPADARVQVALHAADGRVLLKPFFTTAAEAGAHLSRHLHNQAQGLYLVAVDYAGQRQLLKVLKQ